MKYFPLFTDLPPTDQLQISAILSKPISWRTTSDLAILAARTIYIQNNEILQQDSTGLITEAAGNTLPIGPNGFKKGATFILKSGTSNGSYINIGDENIASWQSIENSGRWLFTPSGWDDCWRSAKANSPTTPAWLNLIGDSIGRGSYTTDYMKTSIFALLRAKLLSSYSLYADFYTLVDTSNYSPATPTYPVVLNNAGTINLSGFNITTVYNSNPGFPLITFTTPYACTAIDIVYIDYTSGTWGYAVDGGTTHVVTNTQTGGTSAIMKKISLTGLANTIHTITIGGAGASQNANTIAIIGFGIYNNLLSGIGFANMSYSGMGICASPTSNNYLANYGVLLSERPGLYQGFQGNYAAPTSATGFSFPTQPSLAILQFIINDATQTPTETAFKTGYCRLIQALRRGQPNCSIVFLIPWCADGNTAGTYFYSNDSGAAQITNYRDEIMWIYELANTFNCAVVNIHAKWGETSVTQGFMHASNDVHPNDTGYADIASIINLII